MKWKKNFGYRCLSWFKKKITWMYQQQQQQKLILDSQWIWHTHTRTHINMVVVFFSCFLTTVTNYYGQKDVFMMLMFENVRNFQQHETFQYIQNIFIRLVSHFFLSFSFMYRNLVVCRSKQKEKNPLAGYCITNLIIKQTDLFCSSELFFTHTSKRLLNLEHFLIFSVAI